MRRVQVLNGSWQFGFVRDGAPKERVAAFAAEMAAAVAGGGASSPLNRSVDVPCAHDALPEQRLQRGTAFYAARVRVKRTY